MASDMAMGRGCAPDGQVTRRPAFSTTNRASAAATRAATAASRARSHGPRMVAAGWVGLGVHAGVAWSRGGA